MHVPRSARVSLLMAVLAGACAPREEAPAAASEPEHRAAGATEGVAPTPAAHLETPALPPAAPGQEGASAEVAEPSAEPPRPSDDDLERAARRALAEASRVAPGRDDCETAYARLAALVASMAREAPGTVGELPAQDGFLSVCARLPEAMQRCLVVEHAIDNEEACEREHEALEPELRASLDALMSGGG